MVKALDLRSNGIYFHVGSNPTRTKIFSFIYIFRCEYKPPHIEIQNDEQDTPDGIDVEANIKMKTTDSKHQLIIIIISSLSVVLTTSLIIISVYISKC